MVSVYVCKKCEEFADVDLSKDDQVCCNCGEPTNISELGYESVEAQKARRIVHCPDCKKPWQLFDKQATAALCTCGQVASLL